MLPIQHLPIETPPAPLGVPEVTVQFLDNANDAIQSVTQTVYQHTTDIEPDQGIFNCDCSGFVSFIVEKAAPRHYALIPRERNENRLYFSRRAMLTICACTVHEQHVSPKMGTGLASRPLHPSVLMGGKRVGWQAPNGPFVCSSGTDPRCSKTSIRRRLVEAP